MDRQRWPVRLFRAILRCFPAEFRADFGDEMAVDFELQHAEATRRRGDVARLWLRTAADLLRRAPAEHFEVLTRDGLYAVRVLTRHRAFAIVTLLTLAVGIGLNTAVFSLVYGIMMRPLDVRDSARLVRVFDLGPPPRREPGAVSSADFVDWKNTSHTLDALALLGATRVTLTGDGDPEQLLAMTVSEDFFPMLSVRPTLGRMFTHADYAPLLARYDRSQAPATATVIGGQAFQRVADELPPVVVLGHALWQRRFGGRSDIVGRIVQMNGHPVEIVGVLPADFAITEIPEWGRADCWLPSAADPRQRKARYLSAIGRLSLAVALNQAQAEFDVIEQQLAVTYPDSNRDHGVRLVPWVEAQAAGVRTNLWLLFGAAVCVLMIVAANVANLSIAHASGRRLELATRIALGASRAQLVRQTLTESLVLAAFGGAIGMALAYWTLPVLVSLAPPGVPRLEAVRVDGGMLLFATILSVTLGFMCGLAVVFSLNHANPRPGSLRPSGADAGSHGQRFRRALSVAQIALALVLIVASGLLVRTLRVLGTEELGFDPRHVISIGIAPDARRYVGRADLGAPDRMNAIGRFQTELVSRLRASTGVIAAGIGSRPLGGAGIVLSIRSENGEEHPVAVDVVSGGYLEALGVRMLAGRFFGATDTASAPRVAVINESAAKLLGVIPKPMEHTFRMGHEDVRIVGVIGDTRRATLEHAPEPAIYLSHLQPSPVFVNNLLIRTVGDPRDALPLVRSVMRQLDPEQPLTRIGTLEERIDELLAPRRFMLRLLGLFSAVAFALALIGIYGVISESVAQRVPEIGIRMALGATPASVRNLFLSQGVILALSGSAIGLVGAFTLRHGMSSLVYGVPTTDPLTYAVGCVCLAGATIAACTIPAVRAASLDPIVALRTD